MMGQRRTPFGETTAAVGYVIAARERIYFAGDTACFPGMRELAPLDLALLPVWGWGPTLGPGHLDPARAAAAVQLLRPRVAVPVHWGTLALAGLVGAPGRAGARMRRLLVEPPRTFADAVTVRPSGVSARTISTFATRSQPMPTCTLSRAKPPPIR